MYRSIDFVMLFRIKNDFGITWRRRHWTAHAAARTSDGDEFDDGAFTVQSEIISSGFYRSRRIYAISQIVCDCVAFIYTIPLHFKVHSTDKCMRVLTSFIEIMIKCCVS